MRKNAVKAKDRINQRFGKLLILEVFRQKKEHTKRLYTYVKCQCDCGKVTEKLLNCLTSNKTKSCGCYNQECLSKNKLIHGLSKSRTYRIWRHMRNRCHLKSHPRYAEWGGRGITVCDEWRQSFENFYRDMGEAIGNLSIDRIDNNKGYYKENCRWATVEQQAQNKMKKNEFWGIIKRNKLFSVRFMINKKSFYFSGFKSKQEAKNFRDMKLNEIK